MKNLFFSELKKNMFGPVFFDLTKEFYDVLESISEEYKSLTDEEKFDFSLFSEDVVKVLDEARNKLSLVGEKEVYNTTKKTPSDYFVSVLNDWKFTFLAKNKDYGNAAFDAPALAPNVKAEESILCRISDKFNRLASIKANGKTNVNNESFDDTLKDIAIYIAIYFATRQFNKDNNK